MIVGLLREVKNYEYVSETMFMARASLFEQVKKLHLSFDDFDPSERGKYMLPYGMEILFGLLVNIQGFKIKDPIHCYTSQFFARFYEGICSFVWRRKECSNGRTIVNFCKIPIYKKNRGVV